MNHGETWMIDESGAVVQVAITGLSIAPDLSRLARLSNGQVVDAARLYRTRAQAEVVARRRNNRPPTGGRLLQDEEAE